MDKIVVEGGRRLEGSVPISGAKNAALPILAASLLTDGTCRFTNVPDLQDIRSILQLLQSLGVRAERQADTVILNAASLR